jgi:hypothetical protein
MARSYDFPPRRRAGAAIEEKLGLIVPERVVNSEELLLLDQRCQALHRANKGCTVIFEEQVTTGADGYTLEIAEDVFANGEQFRLAMGLRYTPSIEQAMLWKYEQELPVYRKFEPLLAAARAKGPDPS